GRPLATSASSLGMFSASHALALARNSSTLSSSMSVTSCSSDLADSDSGERAEALAVCGGSAEKDAVHGGSSQVEVQVVLPGDADPAVDLNAVLQDGQGLVTDVGLGDAGQFGRPRVGRLDGPGQRCGQSVSG